MTIQPEDPSGGHHQARNTQELLDAADRVGERQQQRYNRDPSTDEIPVPADARHVQGSRTPEFRTTADQPVEQPARQSMQQGTEAEPEQWSAEQSEPTVEATENDSAAVREPEEQRHEERHEERREERSEHRDRNGGTDDEHVALFDPHEAEELQGRWREVQTAFVDDPRSAVQGADQLVAQVIQSLTASFAAHKKELDGQWQNSDTSGPATEDLRLALRRYRTLFNQLLDT